MSCGDLLGACDSWCANGIRRTVPSPSPAAECIVGRCGFFVSHGPVGVRIGLCWSPFLAQDISDLDRFSETAEVHQVVSTRRKKSNCEPTRHDRSLPCKTAATKKTTKKKAQTKDQLKANKETIEKTNTSVKRKTTENTQNTYRTKRQTARRAFPRPLRHWPFPPQLTKPLSETSWCVVGLHECVAPKSSKKPAKNRWLTA